ncbi:MAG: hypothetical protein AAF388_10695 [Bacteroidota bacterium]
MKIRNNPFKELSLTDLYKHQTGYKTIRGIFLGFLTSISFFLIYLIVDEGTSSVAVPMLILSVAFMIVANALFGRKLKWIKKELETRNT